MVERKEVEALLEGAAEENGRADRHVPPATLAALCRAWMAVEEGDPCEVSESSWHEWGVIYNVQPALIGQRVRVVKEAKA